MVPEVWECRIVLKGIYVTSTIQLDNLIIEENPDNPRENKGVITIISKNSLLKEEVIDRATQEIELLLALNHGYTFEVSIVDTRLINREEIELSNQQVRSLCNSCEITGGQGMRESDYYKADFTNIQKLYEKNNQILLWSIHWFLRACRKNDTAEGFLFLWVTFEILVQSITKMENKEGWEKLFDFGIISSASQNKIVCDHGHVFDFLIERSIKGQNDKNYSKKLSQAISNSNSTNKEILVKALAALKVVRNKLVHAGSADNIFTASQCYGLLHGLVSAIIRDQLSRVL